MHFSLPFFLAPTIVHCARRVEIWEWVSDHSFGSSLQLGLDDTIGDLVADSAGALCGALRSSAGRTLWMGVGRRRIPGENRYEDTEAG